MEMILETVQRQKAAAGSDARMSGCELPVVINSGSGNQGYDCFIACYRICQRIKYRKRKNYIEHYCFQI